MVNVDWCHSCGEPECGKAFYDCDDYLKTHPEEMDAILKHRSEMNHKRIADQLLADLKAGKLPKIGRDEVVVRMQELGYEVDEAILDKVIRAIVSRC